VGGGLPVIEAAARHGRTQREGQTRREALSAPRVSGAVREPYACRWLVVRMQVVSGSAEGASVARARRQSPVPSSAVGGEGAVCPCRQRQPSI